MMKLLHVRNILIFVYSLISILLLGHILWEMKIKPVPLGIETILTDWPLSIVSFYRQFKLISAYTEGCKVWTEKKRSEQYLFFQMWGIATDTRRRVVGPRDTREHTLTSSCWRIYLDIVQQLKPLIRNFEAGSCRQAHPPTHPPTE